MKTADVGNPKRWFGGILPFIGWRVVNVDNDGHPCAEKSRWLADAFSVEWLGFGAILYIGKVYPATQDEDDAVCVQISIFVVHSAKGGSTSYSREQAVKRAQVHLHEQFNSAIPQGRQCTVLSAHSRPFNP